MSKPAEVPEDDYIDPKCINEPTYNMQYATAVDQVENEYVDLPMTEQHQDEHEYIYLPSEQNCEGPISQEVDLYASFRFKLVLSGGLSK